MQFKRKGETPPKLSEKQRENILLRKKLYINSSNKEKQIQI